MLKLKRRHQFILAVAAGLIVAFAGGYVLAMQLVAHDVNAPLRPSPTPILPGGGCHPQAGLTACPMIPAN